MKAFPLFEKTATFGGLYPMLMINRLQLLYFIFILPVFLVHSYMVWGIIALGILSQINLWLLSKWFRSEYASQGYEGFVKLFGQRAVRIAALAGIALILVKISVITLGYVEIVHQFIFPWMNRNSLVLYTILISGYLASKGMEKTMRFVVIAFLGGFWIVAFYFRFYFPPDAHFHDLYPLLPTQWTQSSWKGLLMIWSSLSGPEYLIVLGSWLAPQKKLLKYMTIANAMSVFEYSLLFIASILFFGSNYLSQSSYPVVNMVRYLQSPILDRIDIIMISVQIFYYAWAIGLFLLFFYGAIRILFKKRDKPPTRIGFTASFTVILVFTIIVNQTFWKAEPNQNIWPSLQVILGALTYSLVPAILFAVIKRKGHDAE